MPLKFQCNQDIGEMKSVNGKKFCESCQKNVFDLRRKSIDKIVQLKKEKGECCVIIYEEQFLKVETILAQENISKRKHSSVLPYAAGLAALSLLPQFNYSQSNNKKINSQVRAFERGSSGEVMPIQNPKILIDEAENKNPITEILIKGNVRSSYKKIGKAHDFELGYYLNTTTGKEYVKVLDFSSKITGNFKFKLTNEQLKLLNENSFIIKCEGHIVEWATYSFNERDKSLQLDVTKRRRVKWRGKF